MGLPIMSRGGTVEYLPGNPVAHRFKVLRRQRVRQALVALVQYPDCTNFEGTKILVYDDYRSFERLKASGNLDPHFMVDESSLVARFRPGEEGWQLALLFAESL